MVSSMVSYFVLSFFHEMSWMRSGTELSRSLRIFLPTLTFELYLTVCSKIRTQNEAAPNEPPYLYIRCLQIFNYFQIFSYMS